MAAFLPALSGCAATAPPWIAELGYEAAEVIPVEIGPYGYPYLPARLNEARLDLFLDTGNLSGLFLDPTVAEDLALPLVGRTTARDSGGEVIGMRRVFLVERFETLGRRWTDVEALERPIAGARGAVGPRFLLGRRFSLDYAGGALAVSDSPLPDVEGAVRLIPVDRLAGMIVVPGTVGGREILVQVDTGKSRTCVDAGFAATLGLPPAPGGFRIDDIEVGGHRFAVPSAKPVGFAGISAGLAEPIRLAIGSDVLAGVVMTVDYRKGVLVLGRP